MSRHRDWSLDSKVYVGNLHENTIKSEVESAFCKYGPLKNVWVARNPPGFAFVEFEDARDAEDAVRGLDGTRIAGSRVRVEMSHGRSRRGGYGGGGGGGGGRRYGGRDSYGSGRRDHGRGGRRSRSRSLSKSRSRSRTPRRRYPARSASRSGSRSRSRSASPRGRPRTPPSRSVSRDRR